MDAMKHERSKFRYVTSHVCKCGNAMEPRQEDNRMTKQNIIKQNKTKQRKQSKIKQNKTKENKAK